MCGGGCGRRQWWVGGGGDHGENCELTGGTRLSTTQRWRQPSGNSVRGVQGPTRRRKSSETHLDDRLGAHVVSDLLPVAVVPALGGAGRGRASGVRRVGAGRNLVCFFYVPRGCHGPRSNGGGKRACTHRLMASRNRLCSWSVHDSLDLVIVYGLRALLLSGCFIAAVPSSCCTDLGMRRFSSLRGFRLRRRERPREPGTLARTPRADY